MTIRLATVHENAQVIPLLAKEGSGVVGRGADAGTPHPLLPTGPRKGVIFLAGEEMATGPKRRKKARRRSKMLK